MNVFAFDLGGTKLSSALITDNGKILCEKTLSTKGKKGFEIIYLFKESIDFYLNNYNKIMKNISVVGICIPGIYYKNSGLAWCPNIKEWNNFPLFEEISKLFRKKVLIKIAGDRECYLMGEMWLGNCKDSKNSIFIAVGTGIGAGIMCDGKIIHGASDITGALGWLTFSKTFYEKYKMCGNFEYYASGDGLVRTAKEYISKEVKYDGIFNTIKITTRNLFKYYKKDSLANKVINNSVQLWGMATANLISIFNPEIIVFGGGVFGPAKDFIPQITEEAKKWAQPISMSQVKILPSAFSGRAGLLGAAKIALNSLRK